MLVCARVSLFVRVHVCVCSPHMSKCVSKVPHSFIMSSKCEEQKSRDKQKNKKNKTKESRIEGKVDRKHQRQEVLLWISSRQHSVFNVFISYAYSGVVLMLFVWPPCRQEGDSRPARGGVI